MIRSLYGATRDDLHNLYMPIVKSMEWYKCDSDVNRYLFTHCLCGVDRLIKSYNSNTIINHTLIHYKALLQNFLDGKSEDISMETKVTASKTASPIVNTLKDFWSNHEIFIAYNLVKEMNDNPDEETKQVYCSALENILIHKEKKLYQLIQRSSTQYE